MYDSILVFRYGFGNIWVVKRLVLAGVVTSCDSCLFEQSDWSRLHKPFKQHGEQMRCNHSTQLGRIIHWTLKMFQFIMCSVSADVRSVGDRQLSQQKKEPNMWPIDRFVWPHNEGSWFVHMPDLAADLGHGPFAVVIGRMTAINSNCCDQIKPLPTRLVERSAESLRIGRNSVRKSPTAGNELRENGKVSAWN